MYLNNNFENVPITPFLLYEGVLRSFIKYSNIRTLGDEIIRRVEHLLRIVFILYIMSYSVSEYIFINKLAV